MHLGDIQLHATPTEVVKEILTPEVLRFLAELAEEFGLRREKLLDERRQRQLEFDQGVLPNFLPVTSAIREGTWQIKNIPKDLQDRRLEITGPADRKMIINALNAKAKVFMADFEDSLSPTWHNIIYGQLNLHHAVTGSITYDDPITGKHYALHDHPAVLMCRPRGLHLIEKHLTYNRKPFPAGLFDFAIYFYLNYQPLLNKGSGPYFYLPKMQSHHEARWWDDVFTFCEMKFGLTRGTIKATVLIETLPAVFEMDEILYELRDHIVGLNCGRWDYIFSYIKTLHNFSDRILPDRQTITMDKPFLNAYSRLLIKTCHKRGAMAMGGMSAFIPSKSAEENTAIFTKVKHDKETEARNGHDGTWIAHPGLADIALQAFNDFIPANKLNQLHVLRDDDPPIKATDLLQPSSGTCSEAGLRHNIRVAEQYLASWLKGNGCVPIYGLMEDAATAEIARVSIWQWIQHQTVLDNGMQMNKQLFNTYLQQELHAIENEIGKPAFAKGNFSQATALLKSLTMNDQLIEFLTLPGYEHLEEK